MCEVIIVPDQDDFSNEMKKTQMENVPFGEGFLIGGIVCSLFPNARGDTNTIVEAMKACGINGPIENFDSLSFEEKMSLVEQVSAKIDELKKDK